ncbi:(2Fe-2S)-binding protein [Erythrobacter sp. SG61-1L]|uniref:aromatic ring-hydroxylating oxygenase subunit alpha n=1 Tax=Erythrobacter sp. SG61-1L TaxID=1603897 RepID=UPI0006C92F38|nr:aromatic ring-hydroxylating dioxygenase subunit alpha [Erythrobacter sp. SG61-1L]KPL66851.1 (2Fe-2S)-binding protein [Erythrobacter sp. SG61-1L]
MTLLTDQFFDSFATSVMPTEDAETLPPEIYTSEEFYRFEKEALFYREWLCVGREEWIPASGDYFTASHANEPIIIARDREGNIQAMSAVCQHRAMLVAEGKGNARAFICPYHHWTYDLDGKLVGAPAMNKTCNFDKAKNNLPKLKVELWHGFVFVNFDPDAEALVSRLAPLEPVVANYELEKLRGPEPIVENFAWNWKVQFENNNDGYHASRLHQGLHDYIPSAKASFPEVPKGTAGYYRLNGTLHKNAAFNPTEKALFPVFPKLSEEEQNRLLFVNLPPSLSLVITNDVAIYIIMDAVSATTHKVTFGSLYMPEAMEDPLFETKAKVTSDYTNSIFAQDLHTDLLVQQGLGSKFAPRGRYSWQEDAQRQFNVWLVDRYMAEWDRRRGPAAPITKLHATS